MANDSIGTTSYGREASLKEFPSETMYFAYGSNLSTTQMLQRCPSSIPVGLACLRGWEWLINKRGYANIVQLQYSAERTCEPPDEHIPLVYGILYRLQPADEDMLDMYEGVPLEYQKVVLDVEIPEHSDSDNEKEAKVTKALVYVDGAYTTGSTPKPEYIVRMNRGIDEAIKGWQFPRWYVESVMRKYIPVGTTEEVQIAEK